MVPSTLVFKRLVLVLDLGFLLLPCCHFYKPVVSATGDVHTFQEEEGARKVSTDGGSVAFGGCFVPITHGSEGL